MRLTVGPLPPAVYWRRRVVVLGAGLLFLIVLLYSCNGVGDTGTTPQSKSTPTATAAPGAGDPPAAPAPSGSVLFPQTGAPPDGSDGSGGDPDSSAAPAPTAGPVGNDGPAAPAGPGSGDGTCTDAEISVTPVALSTSVPEKTGVSLQLKIKNKSNRTCSRDVGANSQELYVKAGAEKVWSSDTCGNVKGSDVQSFTPGFERSYQVDWNGRDSSQCKDGLASGPFPKAGAYQVFGRLDTKLSEPAKLTITGS
ncbi:hypothetical protein [Micromonospora sp. RTGN7]|uniref:hypothetical protein n=1 Tax=Micromonospora sp. RTGN7 TaxID=3016526 RepID=UPI0029FF2924|nr:hypothetical protein [Micromonospora sp. RTGN7]